VKQGSKPKVSPVSHFARLVWMCKAADEQRRHQDGGVVREAARKENTWVVLVLLLIGNKCTSVCTGHCKSKEHNASLVIHCGANFNVRNQANALT